MPLSIPIPGAGDEVKDTVRFYVAGSMQIAATSIQSSACNSVEIQNADTYTASHSISVQAHTTKAVRASISTVNKQYSVARRGISVADGDGFMILARILSGDLVNLSGKMYEINGVFKIDNVEYRIKRFEYQAPTGKIGKILNVVLLDTDKSIVDAFTYASSVDFGLRIRYGTVDTYYPLIENGKLNRTGYTMAFNRGPNDEITVGVTDIVSDKFSLAPRSGVIMFDPYKIPFSDVKTDPKNAIKDEFGRAIMPVMEPVAGLTSHMVMNRAYTRARGSWYAMVTLPSLYNTLNWGAYMPTPATDYEGCGFDNVITNIPNYKVKQAEFTLSEGWHSGALPVYAMYRNIQFVEGNDLHIYNIDKPLPPGMEPIEVPLSMHKQLDEVVVYTPESNAVLLTYQADPANWGEGTFVIWTRDKNTSSTTRETGSDGNRTETSLWSWRREFYPSNEIDNVLEAVPVSEHTIVKQDIIVYDADEEESIKIPLAMVRDESITYRYTRNLCQGYSKTITIGTLINQNDDLVWIETEAEREFCTIGWKSDPQNPGQMIQDYVKLDVTGKAVYDLEAEEEANYNGSPISVNRYTSLLEAVEAGVLRSGDWRLTDNITLRRSRTSLDRISNGQMMARTVEVNCLTGGTNNSSSEPVTGNVLTGQVSQYQTQATTKLFRDLESEAEIGTRIPIGINAYELPYDLAMQLGRDALARLRYPPRNMPLTLPSFNFQIRQGVVFRPRLRDGSLYSKRFIVTGFSVIGENLGQTGHKVFQTLEADELLPV